MPRWRSSGRRRRRGPRRLLAHVVMAAPVPIFQRVPMATRPLRLGQSLVEAGRLKERHLRSALDEQQASGRRLGDILVRRGYLDDTAVARALAAQLSLPFAEGPLIPEPTALRLVDAALARTRAVLPLSATNRTPVRAPGGRSLRRRAAPMSRRVLLRARLTQIPPGADAEHMLTYC